MKPILKLLRRILLSLLALVLLLAILAVGGLNIAKFIRYSEYYSIKENLCKNPGLGDGFVCQGIAAAKENGKILVSGYMKNDRASRIYVTDLDNQSYYVQLNRNGTAFTGRAGGVAIYKDTVYIASENRLYTVSLSTLLNAKKGDTVEIGDGTKVNNDASFVYADDKYVYVGEFHDGGKYVTDHLYETPEGTNHAIVTLYEHGDLTSPIKIFSIRDKVQGICFTPNGRIILSTSYGLADSVYYVYRLGDVTSTGKTLDGAPVYALNNCQRTVKGPAMAEGLDYYNGRVITLTESASNKYIFGKFFFANKIVSLDLAE